MSYNAKDPSTWPGCKPYFIAHDVGRVRDRSTAVIGGNSPFGNRFLGILEAIELQQGLYGSARASELAAIDRRYYSNTMIIVDLSNDATYAEFLYETFGQRVIGVHISRYGEGICPEHRPDRGGYLPVYTIGRTYLFDLLHSEFQSDLVRFSDSDMMRRTYEQLNNLQVEYRETGMVYVCPPGQHDDLGISCAMLAWAARHPHLPCWMRNLEVARRPRRPRQVLTGAGGWT
jgi:hypothetical protein